MYPLAAHPEMQFDGIQNFDFELLHDTLQPRYFLQIEYVSGRDQYSLKSVRW